MHLLQLWHNPWMRAEKVDQRVPFVTRKSQLDAIDEWRTKRRPIPSRNEAIRHLVDRGLETEAKEEQQGHQPS